MVIEITVFQKWHSGCHLIPAILKVHSQQLPYAIDNGISITFYS